MDKLINDWDDAELGRLTKDIARTIGTHDSDLSALTTAAAAKIVAALNLANAKSGTFDLKGLIDGHGNNLGDYVVNVSKLSDTPFPEPPRIIDVTFQKKAIAGGLNWKQLKQLAYLYAATVVERAGTKDAPTVWNENKEVFKAIQPIILDSVVGRLLKYAKCTETSPSFDEAFNLIKLKINRGTHD